MMVKKSAKRVIANRGRSNLVFALEINSAILQSVTGRNRDCRVALLLAMTACDSCYKIIAIAKQEKSERKYVRHSIAARDAEGKVRPMHFTVRFERKFGTVVLLG